MIYRMMIKRGTHWANVDKMAYASLPRPNHANENIPGDTGLQLRVNLERMEKSINEIFDLFEERCRS